jgi:hypothetical protein
MDFFLVVFIAMESVARGCLYREQFSNRGFLQGLSSYPEYIKEVKYLEIAFYALDSP